MCGILGIIYKGNQAIEKDLFKSSFKVLKSRGRNEYVYKISKSEVYGYRRLPTDGFSCGTALENHLNDQFPILLFNGIINNTDELLKEHVVDKKNKDFDSYLVKAGLSTHGVNFLSKCRGMFALAFVSSDTVIISRDTIGIKPLFYILEKDRFCFASELKALLPFSPKIVYELLPGEVIILNKKDFSISKRSIIYKKNKKEQSLEKLLFRSLVVPTKRYLVQSNKRVGFLLSGGLDSSILLALLVKYLSSSELKMIYCFCVGSPGSRDRISALLLSQMFKLPIKIISPKSETESFKNVENIVYLTESPYIRVAKVALLQEELAKTISKMNIDVVISGEGADELFYGYRKFIDGLDIKRIDFVYKFFFKEVFYKTLLQRLDRVFAGRCIEARVPYLDQDIVEFALSLNVNNKIKRQGGHTYTKLPLRKLARDLGLPDLIVDQEKLTMTMGATTQDNKEDIDGYLELYFKKNSKFSGSILAKKYYLKYFGFNGVDILTGTDTFDLRDKELSMTMNTN